MSRKPAVPDLFGDSDDEDAGRRPKLAVPTPNARTPWHGNRPAAAAAAAVAADVDAEVREAADKLAAFVAANGRQFEHMTRERNPGDTPFKFLWNKGSREYRYYEARLQQELAKQPAAATAGGGGGGGGGPSGPASTSGRPAATTVPHSQPPHAPGAAGARPAAAAAAAAVGGSSTSGRKRSRWDDKAPPAGGPPPPAAPPPAAAAAAGRLGPPPALDAAGLQAAAASAAAAAAAVAARLAAEAAGGGRGSSGAPGGGGGGTLSAMEQYMRRLDEAAAQKRREDEEEEEERRRRAAQPLLKETAFDRRKVVAVYKDDGERGHHMGDYIPKEELAKFMTQCGDTSMQQQVEGQSSIGADNIGHKLLQKMGWQQGKGIGAKEDGRTAPVAAAGAGGGGAAATGMKQDTLGLGAQAHGAVEEGDDIFEQYRKRMMLGYKYRPNPLGNPRRAYY